MNRYVFPLAVVALTLCQSALADGYIPYGRLMPSRMPNALFTSTGTTSATNGETLNAPATVKGNATGYEGYPFVDRCGSGYNSCCEGVWSGYSRQCVRGHKCGHRGFGKYGFGGCGCDTGYGGYVPGSGCDNACNSCGCGAGGWGRGGCFGNSFAGGCGGCWGLGLGGFKRFGFGFSCGCDNDYSTYGGCSSCGSNGYSSGTMNGVPTNMAPTPQIPTPAAEEAPPVAPATKSALRPYVPRGYLPRVTNW